MSQNVAFFRRYYVQHNIFAGFEDEPHILYHVHYWMGEDKIKSSIDKSRDFHIN